MLQWLQASALGVLVRESGVWTYPFVNLAHVLGIGSLFGAVLVLDLTLLGRRRGSTLPAVAAVASPVATVGAALALASGAAMLSANATEYAGNPFLYVKFPAIAVGLLNALAIRRSQAWRLALAGQASADDQRRLRVMAAISLVAWLTAIAAGRLIAYW